MKKIAIIDADLINRKKHRFPNLACLKMSGYWKEQGYNVNLLTEYSKDVLFGGMNKFSFRKYLQIHLFLIGFLNYLISLMVVQDSFMKKLCLFRQPKEYIYFKGEWDNYIKYLKREIKKL